MIINDFSLDIFLLSLESRKDISCYLCNSKLFQPQRVENYPPEYRICCLCKTMLKRFIKADFTYNDVVEIIQRTTDKLILSEGTLRRKHLSKYERECIQLFINQSLMEKDVVLQKFRTFFFSVDNI